MHMRLRLLILLVVVGVVATACSGDEGEATTTTSNAATVTSLAAAQPGDGGDADTDSAAGETTTTTLAEAVPADPEVPTFSIVSREEGEEGDVVVVLLDRESYGSLTDIDLQNVLAVLVEDFPPVYEAHVVDDENVTELVVAAPGDIDEEEQRLLDLHYLVRLDEGFRITYVGPFEDVPTAILGS